MNLPPKNLPLGATPLEGGGTHFRVWAPKPDAVELEVQRNGALERFALTREADGYHTGIVADAGPGDRYGFLLDHPIPRPDPASRFQPEGVHGRSEIVDPRSYRWRDSDWKGVPFGEWAVYEIHVGTFTPSGTFLGARERLDELLSLGINALEIMPVAQTPGRWNWGYDGVNLFAPAHAYGTPDDFKALVDACHERGMAVILDVVYNHVGPEGNYLGEFGPYASRKHRTPWGDAFNYDEAGSEHVRNFILSNVRYWIEEFHLDGLRLDAIRLMHDDSSVPIVEEIAASLGELRSNLPRPIHLIGEANVYDGGLLDAGYDGIWSDELPHAILAMLIDQEKVADRIYDGPGDLELCLEKGFVYEYRNRAISRPKVHEKGRLPLLVQGLQTHDQVGNHPNGWRLSFQTGPEAQRAAAALVLLYPSIPFIFMGEEFASPSPFCFFTDFGDDHLRRAVERGRKRDYAHHDWKDYVSPLSEEAFFRSKLPDRSEGDAGTLSWYRDLLRIRREWMDRGILDAEKLSIETDPERGLFLLDYGSAWVAARLGRAGDSSPERIEVPRIGRVIAHSRDDYDPGCDLGINEALVGGIG